MDTGSVNELSLKEERIRVSRPGITSEELAQNYSKWAERGKYDKDLQADQYMSPQVAASMVEKYVPEQKDLLILDVAAGTGLVAEKLREFGFTNMDALDPSEGMLQVAREKSLYRKYLHAFFTDNVEEVQTSAYDILVCCGAMGEGHLKLNTLPEMIRCVKTGGLIILLTREKVLVENPEYKDRMAPYIKQLEAEGKWTLLEMTVFPNYARNVNGVKFAFRVTK